MAMIVRGAGETFNLVVPIRRIHAWTKRVNIEWVVNPNVPVPKDDEWFKKGAIEDTHHNNTKKDVSGKEYKFLIK